MPVKTGVVLRELAQYRPGAPKKYTKLPVKKVESIARPGINSLTVRSVVTGEFIRETVDAKGKATGAKSKRKYRTSVQFFEVQFSETKSKFFTAPVAVAKRIMFMHPPNLKENSVKLKCECEDFRFRFEKELFDHKGLIGRFRKYIRKTPKPPEGHPFVNPEEKMGYCKHVNSLLKSLKTSKRITG
jgi:hypothetical protein